MNTAHSPPRPQGKREMAAASEVISGKELRERAQEPVLQAECSLYAGLHISQPDWPWCAEGLSICVG